MTTKSNFYKSFQDVEKEFKEKEARAFCYELATRLIEEAKKTKNQELGWFTHKKTIDAILLLLFCWNFAARKTKKLNRKKVSDLFKKSKKELDKLSQNDITDFSEEVEGKIKSIFEKFNKVFDQTGASKALNLLNPKLFVMWDTEIRQFIGSKKKMGSDDYIKGISKGDTGDSYLKFLKGVKENIKKYNLGRKIKNPPIAKRIDEFHYLKISKIKKNKKDLEN